MAEKKHVLIIDDESDFVAIIKERLEFEGYEVTSAQNGKVGLEMMHQMDVDIVLLDIMMPEMNGFEVLAKIREEGAMLAKPPIIILTAYSYQFSKKQEHDLSDVASTLYKPFDMNNLLSLMRGFA